MMLTAAESEIVVKLAAAAFVGMVIGVERQLHHKPAGMRTHVLVCIGSCLFTIVAIATNIAFIAAGVVSGIGFLAAGIIIQTKDKVYGLTTAAELWVLAAIGLAVGFGLYFVAFATAVIMLVVLVPMKPLEDALRKRK